MHEFDCTCSRRPGLKCDGNCDIHPAGTIVPEVIDSDKRSAIVERREQIGALARPSKLSQTDIIGEVAQVRETADLYKVYRPEWIVVFTSKSPYPEGRTEAEAHFAEKYEGRVREDDIDIVSTSKANPQKYPVQLVLRLPNIKGEFKTKDLAEAYVAEQGWINAEIVSRNSRDEHLLREYGKKKLPKVNQ